MNSETSELQFLEKKRVGKVTTEDKEIGYMPFENPFETTVSAV